MADIIKSYLAKNYKSKEDKTYTHTRIKGDNNSGGIYNLKDEDEFMEIYKKYIMNGGIEYLTEKQLEGDKKRLCVDIDLRYSTKIKTRQHTQDHIIDLIHIYLDAIKEICNIENGYEIDVFVMEKPNVNILEDKTKDGIHLVFGIALNKYIQKELKNIAIKRLTNLWDDLPLTNTFDDVIDESIVMGSTNWILYGSTKPNNEVYKVSSYHKLRWVDERDDWVGGTQPHNNIDFNRISIRNMDIQTASLKDGIVLNEKEEKEEKEEKVEEEEEEEEKEEKRYTKQELQEIIDKLPKEAYCVGNGNYCFNIICALKKSGATRNQAKNLCMKAGEDYDDEWFKNVWKQNTLKYNFGIAYLLSKSLYRRENNINETTPSVGYVPIYENTEYLKIKEEFENNNFRLDDLVAFVCNEKDHNGDKKMLMYKLEIFKQKYAHLTFKDYQMEYPMGRTKNFIDVWNTDINKKSYKSTQVIPHDRECPDYIYNLWDGYACEKTILPEGYVVKGKTDNINKVLLYLCENDENNYKFFKSALAHMLKYPSTKEKIAFFFTGAMGVGKSTLKEILYKLLGSNIYTEPNDAEQMFCKYNKSQRLNKLVGVFDEASNMKKYTKKILSMITNDKVNIEEKNEPSMPNMTCIQRLFILSNDVDIIKIDNDDRRFVVFNPYDIPDKTEKEVFFNNVYKDINDKEILRVFYDELMAMSIEENYNFQLNRPKTEYFNDIKTANTPLTTKFLYCADIKGSLTDNTITSTQLYNHFCNWLLIVGIKFEFTNTKFGLDIKKDFLKKEFSFCGIKKYRTNQGNSYKIDIDILHSFIENELNYNGDF
jgi:hypothetical protein